MLSALCGRRLAGVAAGSGLRRAFGGASSVLSSHAPPSVVSTWQLPPWTTACKANGAPLRGRSPARLVSTMGPFVRKRLRALEDAANAAPHDTSRALALYQAANRAGQPALVVRRVESRIDALDANGAREYVKALSSVGRLDRLDLADISQRVQRGAVSAEAPWASSSHDAYSRGAAPSWSGAAAGAGGRAPSGATAGDEPLQVVVTEPLRAQIWRVFRNLVVAGAVVLMISMVRALARPGRGEGRAAALARTWAHSVEHELRAQVLEERGLTRGATGGLSAFTTDVKPVTSSNKTFDDVVGVDEVKAELEEIVRYLRSPKTFTRLGGKLPKGVMLTGPPGTGKTLLARAVAGEAGVPFFYMSGSEFEEVFVGVGARRVRDLFSAAKARAPCIIFIDEIDAIGSHRNPKDQQAMKMTLNQLLVELDGFNQNEGVIVIGATNFPEVLDRALVRPGRFDTMINVPLPDVKGRQQILELHSRPIPLAPSVNIETIARATPGFSGADLHNLMNVAALKASTDGLDSVGMAALEYACDKIRMGAERKSAHISKDNLRMTAYHEGGHALVALYTPAATPIHKATIVPRGMALGMVSYLPEKDQLNLSRQQMLALLDVAMGGRIAEEIVFGTSGVTTGAQGDLATATSIARNMVTRYGMSEAVGPIYAGEEDLGQLSPATRELIDKEVQQLLQVCAEAPAPRPMRARSCAHPGLRCGVPPYRTGPSSPQSAADRARSLLKSRQKELHLLAAGLQKHETLSLDEIKKIVNGERLK